MTENVLPNRLRPKRPSKIRSFFDLDDVKSLGEVKSAKKSDAKPYTKATRPSILYVVPINLPFSSRPQALKIRTPEGAEARIQVRAPLSGSTKAPMHLNPSLALSSPNASPRNRERPQTKHTHNRKALSLAGRFLLTCYS